MARLPTPRQKTFVKEFLKQSNGRRAAMVAYKTDKVRSADQIAYQNIRKPVVIDYMTKLLDKAGLSDEAIAESLEKIVKAGTAKRALKQAKPDDALRGIEMAIRAKGLFPAEKKQIESRTLELKLEGKSEEELQGMLTNMMKEIMDFKKKFKRLEAMGVTSEDEGPEVVVQAQEINQ